MLEIESALDPLFRDLHDGACVVDEDGSLLYLNPSAARVLGTRPPRVLGQRLCVLLCARLAIGEKGECVSRCPLLDPDSGRDAVTFQGEYAPGLSYQWEEAGVTPLGGGKKVRVRCQRMPVSLSDESRHWRVAILEDLSVQADLERRREDWRDMIAHDLRTPLTTVFTALSLLRDNPAEPTKESPGPDMIDAGLLACRRMTALLDLYMNVVKLDAGKADVRMSRLCLLDLVSRAVEEQSLLARKRRIQFDVDVDAKLAVRADAELFPRVLQNVLDNAIKFSPAGGRVGIAARPIDAQRVAVTVADAGFGIDPADLPRIFDRYFQSKARRQGRIRGTGLGLAFCRESMKAMEGDISAAAAPGGGSVFTLIIPGARPTDR